MSLKPPNRRISPFTMTSKDTDVGDDDNLMMMRVPSMDSSIAFSETSSAGGPWICPQCSYSNVDYDNEKCALCGMKDSDHYEKKVVKRKARKSSWLSLGSVHSGGNVAGFDFRNQQEQNQPATVVEDVEAKEEEEDSSTIIPSLTQPWRRSQTSGGLQPKTSLPISRPDRDSESDAEPTISLPKRALNSPQGERPVALDDSRSPSDTTHSNNANSQSNRNRMEETEDPCPETPDTSNSRSSLLTVKMSNHQVPLPRLLDSSSSTPPTSNRSLASSTRSMASSTSGPEQRSIRAPLLVNGNKDHLQREVQTFRQHHSENTPINKSNKLHLSSSPYQQPHQEDDYEQSSYLPNSIRTTTAGKARRGRSSPHQTPISSTQMIPPSRKLSEPHHTGLVDPHSVSLTSSSSKKGKKSKRNSNNTKTTKKENSETDSPGSRKSRSTKEPSASTAARSVASTSFAEETSIEADWNEQQRQAEQVTLPFDVMPGHDNDDVTGSRQKQQHDMKSKNRRIKYIFLIGTAMLIVSALIAFGVTKAVVGNNKDEQKVQAQNPAISIVPSITPSPGVSPEPTLPPIIGNKPPTDGIVPPPTEPFSLELIETVRGNTEERLGSVVSVGGSDLVAVGGVDFVRILRRDHVPDDSRESAFVQAGQDLKDVDSKGQDRPLRQVSLGNDRRVAIAWEGHLSVQHLNGTGDEWNVVFSHEYDQGQMVSTAMSGDGRRFAATGIRFPGSVEIYGFEDVVWEFKNMLAIEGSDENGMQLELSYDGETIVVLSSGRIVSYVYNGRFWDKAPFNFDVSDADLNFGIPFTDLEFHTLTLSGDGLACAVAGSSTTRALIHIFVYDKVSRAWLHANVFEEIGIENLALDYAGRFLAATKGSNTKPWSLCLWYRENKSDPDYMPVPGLHEASDLEIGASVAMANYPNSYPLLVVGAPNEKTELGETGSVRIYEIKEAGGKRK